MLDSHYLLHETLESLETAYYIEERLYEPTYRMKFKVLDTVDNNEALKEFLKYVDENNSEDALLLYKQKDGTNICILDLDDIKLS